MFHLRLEFKTKIVMLENRKESNRQGLTVMKRILLLFLVSVVGFFDVSAQIRVDYTSYFPAGLQQRGENSADIIWCFPGNYISNSNNAISDINNSNDLTGNNKFELQLFNGTQLPVSSTGPSVFANGSGNEWGLKSNVEFDFLSSSSFSVHLSYSHSLTNNANWRTLFQIVNENNTSNRFVILTHAGLNKMRFQVEFYDEISQQQVIEYQEFDYVNILTSRLLDLKFEYYNLLEGRKLIVSRVELGSPGIESDLEFDIPDDFGINVPIVCSNGPSELKLWNFSFAELLIKKEGWTELELDLIRHYFATHTNFTLPGEYSQRISEPSGQYTNLYGIINENGDEIIETRAAFLEMSENAVDPLVDGESVFGMFETRTSLPTWLETDYIVGGLK